MPKSDVYNIDCLGYMKGLPDKVFDPMMGSQSSRIAAWNLGFDYVGCELDKEYFGKGCERFDYECQGIIKRPDGSVIQQMSLF